MIRAIANAPSPGGRRAGALEADEYGSTVNPPKWDRKWGQASATDSISNDFNTLEMINGAPGTIRTSDPQIRSLMLYPAELRARTGLDGEGGYLAGRSARRNPVFALSGTAGLGGRGGGA